LTALYAQTLFVNPRSAQAAVISSVPDALMIGPKKITHALNDATVEYNP